MPRVRISRKTKIIAWSFVAPIFFGVATMAFSSDVSAKATHCSSQVPENNLTLVHSFASCWKNHNKVFDFFKIPEASPIL